MAELSTQDVFSGTAPLERLLEELEAMYPPYTPTPKDEDRVIMYRSGQRSVVDYIKIKLSQ